MRRPVSSAARVAVRVIPRASRNEIEGFEHGRLKIRTIAPPVDGKANTAIEELLALELNVPRRCVQVIKGFKSRSKLVEIQGYSLSQIALRFARE